LYIRIDGHLSRIPHRDILYVEGNDEGVAFHTQQEVLHSEMGIRDAAEKLQDSHFLKINRSHIVNLKVVTEVKETSVHLPGKVIAISRARRPVLMRHLNLL